MTTMTIFISPKPFNREHIATIQWNAIQSWKQLGEDVDIVLIGEDIGVREAAEELGVRYIAEVKRNESGTPLLSDIFALARDTSDSPLLAYVNADIILFPDFLEQARRMMEKEKKFLLVGQRWDLDIPRKIDFSNNWQGKLRKELADRGRRHPAGGSDYFIFPRTCFEKIPDFAIGRSGWDNWMFYEARKQGWKLIDCTKAIDIIHQDHDYAHLPNGQSHYRLPESKHNVELAGGKRTIFTLLDCDWQLESNGNLVRPPRTKKKILREMEIFPLIKLKSRVLGEVGFAVFHPEKAYREFRSRKKKD
ncbi:MAG TPA: hypothetical protein PLD39_03365 [Flexilinea sp.]|nr:hypothetical protein [Flexilinea sp.]HOU18612.1 hypothetical protein [Flexilinea sp.]HPB39886.1 hypothetical protein [Flexilinea sp.]HPL56694.1 hypothetical protein [Flexilinea sp.]HQF79366.1 hypothetical protein [Flexilinea sp.]